MEITNLEGGRPVFSATMDLRRRELSEAAMLGLLVRYPPMTLATLARIYANALRLRLRGRHVPPAPAHGSPAPLGGRKGGRLT